MTTSTYNRFVINVALNRFVIGIESIGLHTQASARAGIISQDAARSMTTTMSSALKQVCQGAVYTVTPAEARTCYEIACARQQTNDAANVFDAKSNTQRSSVDLHMQGLLGEYAFLRMHGLSTADVHDTHVRCAATDTFDAVMADGRRVDVKTVMRANCDLHVTRKKLVNAADVFVLMYVHVPASSSAAIYTPGTNTGFDVEFCGAIESGHLFNVSNYGRTWTGCSYNFRYVCKSGELKHWHDLTPDVAANAALLAPEQTRFLEFQRALEEHERARARRLALA